MQERRTSDRLRVDLKARWEGLITQGRGSVCDLSSTGCFVLSGGEINQGELVRLEIYFTRDIYSLFGEVVYTVAEIGFAVRFAYAGADEKRELERLMESLRPRV